MLREPNIVRVGFTALSAGMDSNAAPDALLARQCALLVNASVRDGFVHTRPGFSNERLTWPDTETQTWAENHNYQGGGTYLSPTGEWFVAFAIGGRFFLTTLKGVITEITPWRPTVSTADFISPPVGLTGTLVVSDSDGAWPGYPLKIGTGRYTIISVTGLSIVVQNQTDQAGVNHASGAAVSFLDVGSPQQPQVWWKQAEHFLFAQDNQSACVIYDGANSRRSNPADEVPTGSVMEYYAAIGRLAVAVGQEIALGDYTGDASDLVKFTEEHEFLKGGRFRVPTQYGPIRMLANLPTLDTTVGHGSMLVGATEAIFSLNLQPDRSTWKSMSKLMTMVLPGHGPENSSVATVNGDIFYRSRDGWRSFKVARGEFGTWGNTPISAEMNRILEKDTQSLLRYSSAVAFDNRLLLTAEPLPTSPHSSAGSGLAVLDFTPINRMGNKAPPVWDGFWSGIRPLGLFALADRCFALTANTDSSLGLVEITADNPFDGDGGRIEGAVESAAMPGQVATELFRLHSADLWVDQVVGDVELTLYYRPDDYPCWYTWNTKTICAKAQECQDDDVCQAMTTFEPGYRTRLRFRQPASQCDPLDKKPSDTGYSFQFRLEWKGKVRIRKFIARLARVVEEVSPADA